LWDFPTVDLKPEDCERRDMADTSDGVGFPDLSYPPESVGILDHRLRRS
jgi:hypothetical protein